MGAFTRRGRASSRHLAISGCDGITSEKCYEELVKLVKGVPKNMQRKESWDVPRAGGALVAHMAEPTLPWQ